MRSGLETACSRPGDAESGRRNAVEFLVKPMESERGVIALVCLISAVLRG